jgi:hypothetical protein
MTRDLYSEVGEYDVTYKIAADYDLLARALRIQSFDREARSLATFRRHGENASIVQKGASDIEVDRVAEEYGPRNRLRRAVLRFGLKTWLNSASPRWYLAKRFGLA